MNTSRTLLLLATAAAALAGTAARADDLGRGTVPASPAYQRECSACHIAYPPGLLPAASWQRLMSNLPRHFGTDASLDEATQRELSAWLQAHANGGKRAVTPPPEDRITRSRWFLREHDEVSATTWQRPAVKSPSNCAACHRGADQGDFDEHQVRIPR